MDRFVFVRNWLVAAGQVNDAEPAHSQADVLLYQNAFFIRAAMDDRIAHPAHDLFVDSFCPI
jgi:hypothetical protein